MLGVCPQKEKELFRCGKGTVAVWKTNPCYFTFSKNNADEWRAFYKTAVPGASFSNRLLLQRNEYVAAAVMDESVNDDPLILNGLYADMFTEGFDVITEKRLRPGENALLCDITRLPELSIVGTSLRVLSLSAAYGKITAVLSGAGGFNANIRLKVPSPIVFALLDGSPCAFSYDDQSQTVLVSFESTVGERHLVLHTEDAVC